MIASLMRETGGMGRDIFLLPEFLVVWSQLLDSIQFFEDRQAFLVQVLPAAIIWYRQKTTLVN